MLTVEQKAQQELNEPADPAQRLAAIAHVYDAFVAQHGAGLASFLLNGSSSTGGVEDRDEAVLRFLRVRKYDEARTLQLMAHFAAYKRDYASFFFVSPPGDEGANALRAMYAQRVVGVLPQTSKDGCIVMYLRLARIDFARYTIADVFRGMLIFHTEIMRDPRVQTHGLRIIQNLDGLSLMFFRHAGADDRKRMFAWIQDSMPARVKGLHVLHHGFIFSVLFGLISPLLSAKMRSRFRLCGNDASGVADYIDPTNVPDEVEGGRLPMDSVQWQPRFLS